MRTLTAISLTLLAAFAIAGCGKSGADEKPMVPPSSFNNNAPEAKSAQAAPPITDTPTPGEALQKGRRRNVGGGGAPPAGAPP